MRKKIQILGLALFAVFALSAVVAGAASANSCKSEASNKTLAAKWNTQAACEDMEEANIAPAGEWSLEASEPEWLVKGNSVLVGLESETTGALLLIHLAGGFLEPEAVIECSGVFDGLVLSKGEDTVEALLSGGVEITLSNTLACTNIKNCPTPLVVAENLPWKTQLSLMTSGSFLDLFSAGPSGLLPGYEIRCDGLSLETLCEGETSATIELMSGSTALLGTFNAAELESEGLEGNCESHVKVALQEGAGEIALKNGEELDVSEEE